MTARMVREIAHQIEGALPVKGGAVEEFTPKQHRALLEICDYLHASADEMERIAYEANGDNTKPAADAPESAVAILGAMAAALGAHADLWAASMTETQGDYTATYRVERSPR